MPKETHHYTNGEVTVVWKPKVCIHSTLCWKGLLDVFNPRERPWIKMEGADTARIIEQVKHCPSGALSYFMNAEQDNTPPAAESGQQLAITVSPDGPYLVQSECRIIHSDGSEEIRTGSIALCRCGASQNKPWCDGSHSQTGFKD